MENTFISAVFDFSESIKKDKVLVPKVSTIYNGYEYLIFLHCKNNESTQLKCKYLITEKNKDFSLLKPITSDPELLEDDYSVIIKFIEENKEQ